MKKTLLSLAAAAVLGLASASASAEFLDFKVNEAVVEGAATAKNFTADKLNGAYEELLQVTGPGTFSASAYATFDGYRANEGTTQITGELVGYTIYAVFQATGVITGPNTFQGTAGSIKIYIDRNEDTIGTLTNGLVAATLSNTVDDDLIGSSNVSFGTGDLSANPGAYALYFEQFALTAFGQSYWYDPNPFYKFALSNGDNDVFTATANPGEFRVTGDTSAVFQPVPEPASIALMGLALAGLGVARRRRNK
jgi:hypothetical protein